MISTNYEEKIDFWMNLFPEKNLIRDVDNIVKQGTNKNLKTNFDELNKTYIKNYNLEYDY